MSSWLDPLARVLGRPGPEIDMFFRDDDAGWNDPYLVRLLDLFGQAALPLDVAAIPAALTDPMARELLERTATGAGGVTVHQHGLAHTNHEPAGRPCEFGQSRETAAVRRDIREGWSRLSDQLGTCLAPVFTPPWNRCTWATAQALSEEGFAVLSREGAPVFNLPGLAEIPISVDWFKKRSGARVSRQTLGQMLADAVVAGASGGSPVGLMLHHACMADSDFRALAPLLSLLASSERVRPHSILGLTHTTAVPTGLS